MALAIASLDTGNADPVGTTQDTASVSPTADAIVFIAVSTGITGANEAPSGISGNGLSWTEIANVNEGEVSTGDINMSVWWATGASPSAGAITMTWANSPDNVCWEVFEITGADTTTPIVQSKTDGTLASDSAPALTLDSAPAATSALVGCFGKNSTSAVPTAGTGYTQIGAGTSNGSPSNQIFCEYDLTAPNDGVIDMSWDNSASVVVVGFEVQEAAAGGTITPPLISSTSQIFAPALSGGGVAVGAGTEPTIFVEVAFTTDPSSGSPIWTEISSDVRSGTVTRGRQRELDRFQAGTMTLILDNRQRQYDPTYSAGTHFGNILPMKRVRLRAKHGATTYPVFDGYVDSWNQVYEKPNDAVVELTATDGFKILALKQLPSSAYELEVRTDNPVMWWRLDEDQGATTAIDSVSGYVANIVGGPGSDPDPTFGEDPLIADQFGSAMSVDSKLEGLRAENVAEPSGASDFSIEGWIRVRSDFVGSFTEIADNYLNSGTVNSVRLSRGVSDRFSIVTNRDTGTGTSILGSTGTVPLGTTHHVVFTGEGSAGSVAAAKSYIDGTIDVDTTAVMPNFGNSGQQFIVIGNRRDLSQSMIGTLDELAVYNTVLSATRITAHYDAGTVSWAGDTCKTRIDRVLDFVGWPAGERDIDTGKTTLQETQVGGSALEFLQTIEETESGLLFMSRDGKVTFIDRTARFSSPYTTAQETFGDAGSEIPYQDILFDYSEQPIRNVVKISRDGGVPYEASDSASITSFYPRSLERLGLMHQTDEESKTRAEYEVSVFKDVELRVTEITVMPRHDPDNEFPAVLGRELGDRLNVKRRPQGIGSAIDQDVLVEGITHEFAPKHWATTLQLSPVQLGPFWILEETGASELGESTYLGF